MKITILVDNRITRPELRAEHGLALWIESEGKRILFDTGQGGSLGKNAKILGVDLGKTDIIMLSHGHYDHSGGMAQVMNRAEKAELYCHPGVVLPRYSISDGIATPVHMPQPSLAAIVRLPPTHIHWLQQPIMLSAHIGLSGPIPRETSYEDTGGPFYLDPQGKRPDSLSDDLALWMQTMSGLVVCVGCSHAGLVNTLNHVRLLNNGQKIRAVIGGFHLRSASPDRLAQTIAALRQLEPDMVVPCHCTGELAVAALRNALGERISTGAAGLTYQF
jgi:7,8-dihydropterin-6-yl-methyl-4-(beta-D-ribofuranosyl)aminobenzene 5'-phosphate synthase